MKVFIVLLLVIAAFLLVEAKDGRSHGGYPAAYYQVKPAVCHYFGRDCAGAMRVVRCETGGRYNTTARNGQYLGIFQMGSYARRKYGHGSSAWAQSRSAYRYFVESGRDWSPWACKP